MHGRKVLIGNGRLMDRDEVDVSSLAARVNALADNGKTAMYAAVDRRTTGGVAVPDAPFPSAPG